MRSLKQAERLANPQLVEASAGKAPNGYRPLRQFIRRTVQDGIRITREETGIEDLTAIPGHFEIKSGGRGRHLTWCNYGCLVFGRGEPAAKPVIKPNRLVLDPRTKKMVPAIRDPKGECSSCGDVGVIAQTGFCPTCTWGDANWTD